MDIPQEVVSAAIKELLEGSLKEILLKIAALRNQTSEANLLVELAEFQIEVFRKILTPMFEGVVVPMTEIQRDMIKIQKEMAKKIRELEQKGKK